MAGGVALGTALTSAWEWPRDDPDWAEAVGRGSVLGALGGAALLILDSLITR